MPAPKPSIPTPMVATWPVHAVPAASPLGIGSAAREGVEHGLWAAARGHKPATAGPVVIHVNPPQGVDPAPAARKSERIADPVRRDQRIDVEVELLVRTGGDRPF